MAGAFPSPRGVQAKGCHSLNVRRGNHVVDLSRDDVGHKDVDLLMRVRNSSSY